MAEYLAPGVYTEQVESGAMPIEGASTSTAGLLGETERGPVVPQFLTSFEDYRRKFGGFAHYRDGEPLAGTSLAYAVQGFFQNGGSRCYVGRVTNEEGVASRSFPGYEPVGVLGTSVDEIDFGEYVTDRSVRKTVLLHNVGIENDPAVQITDIEVTGDDSDEFRVSHDLDFDSPGELPPEEFVEVDVLYEPEVDDDVEATIEVTHDGVGSPLKVDLKASGLDPDDAAELTLDPLLVDFGTVEKDEPTIETVTLSNSGPIGASTLEVNAIGVDPGDEFAVSFPSESPPFEFGQGEEVDIDITFNAGDGATETLEVEVEDAENVEFDLVGAAIDTEDDPLGSTVSVLGFGTVVTNTEHERTFDVVNLGTETLELEELNASPDTDFGAEFLDDPGPLKPGGSAGVIVTFSPENEATYEAPGSGTLEVVYEHGSGQKFLEVDLAGAAEDEDASLVAKDALEFEQTVVEDGRTRNIKLENEAPSGAAAIVVDSLEIEDDGDGAFSVPEDAAEDLTIDPGESVEIPVTFTPEFTGNVSAKLEIAFAALSAHEVHLAGEGVEPVSSFEAVGPGEWGGRVAVQVRNSSRDNETFRVTIKYWTGLSSAGPSSETIRDAQSDPDVEETYNELSTDEASSNYYVSKINDSSQLVNVARNGSTRPDNGIAFLQLPEEGDDDNDGDDGIGLSDYLGDETAPRGKRTGLAGFEERDDISIVCIPDENQVPNLAGVAADHCEQMEDRFAVMQAEQGADPGSLPPQSTISDFGAIYYPHVEVIDAETNEKKTVPPGGHIAGIYARTDAERGVHKAPANEVVRGAVGLEVPVTRADQERLNPKGVNAIRSFQSRGIRVWGARTTSPNPLWRYVNVRRLMLFIEESIENGTQWAVFEPNDEALWARLRQSVRNFLTTVWRSGGLMGSTEDEAFYVKCDRTTMTQDDIDNGRLIVEVGVAPTKPAEFVIFRITQWTDGVEGGS